MPIYVTHCDIHYATRALALIGSLRENKCSDEIMVVCHDTATKDLIGQASYSGVIILEIEALLEAYPALYLAKNNRSKSEFMYCLTPFVIKTALDHNNYDMAVYIDSDLFFYADPNLIIQEIPDEAHTAITSHNFIPKNYHLAKYGNFNVGWLAFKNSLESLALLDWWATKCIESTSSVLKKEVYGDQKYLDKFSEISPSVYVIKNKGVNAGPWNCSDITIWNSHLTIPESDDGLIAFHFSGYKKYRFVSVLGYSGYGYRPSKELKLKVFQRYIVKLEEFEKRKDLSTPRESRKFKIRDWVRILWYRDFIFSKVAKKQFD